MKNFSENVKYVGADDKNIDLFESQYLVPKGVSYNSYVITDEKIAIMDTVDRRKTDEWLKNLKCALGGENPDYLVISHMEPDHSASIAAFLKVYPDTVVVGNAKTFQIAEQFFGDIFKNKLVVKDGDKLSLGTHELTFVFAPMIHWPEVMVSYESSEKILFSADAFGKFGALDADEDWDCEARRYYINIVGKYGAQVQTLLKKAAALDIRIICPLHGPILTENLGHYIEKYNIWSSYRPETEGTFIACASIHGHTYEAARKLEKILKDRGEKAEFIDLTRQDMSKAVENAFRYDKTVLAASSYDGGVFPPMEDFLNHLKAKNFQNRKVSIIENGSWAPSAGRVMRAALETMKNIEIGATLTIKSALKDESELACFADGVRA